VIGVVTVSADTSFVSTVQVPSPLSAPWLTVQPAGRIFHVFTQTTKPGGALPLLSVPRTYGLGVVLIPKDGVNERLQWRKVLGDDIPHERGVKPMISVPQPVAEINHPLPGD
jgi:hypothetical protein